MFPIPLSFAAIVGWMSLGHSPFMYNPFSAGNGKYKEQT